ncbi:acyltransferase family protein [uncultured Tyzzerella sp.]|uniref:acyltransferase family protein n=1 Tax=uncultured Tyzzerella sp. TaxID=2321398 RepID=UPI0029422F04|nr:acyltransferase family protein [uncultured Tyzzerella sp.]
MKDRNLLFDNIKGLLIFLVVFGHSLELLKNNYEIAKIIYTFIYIFHMPAFIFISGYFSKNLKKSQDTAFEKFLIPFLLITLPWNIVLVLLGITDFYSFFTPAWAMWYLYSMFVWKLILPYILKIKNIFKVCLFLGILAGLFIEFNDFMSISRTITFLPYFLAGYFFDETLIDKIKNKKHIIFVLLILLTFTLSVIFSLSDSIPVEILWLDRPFINLKYPIRLGLVIRIILYFLGFLMTFALINITTCKQCFLSKIGKNTLSVYILHIFLIGSFFGISKSINNNILNLLLCTISSIIVTYILSRDAVNNTVLRFLTFITNKIMYKEH